LITDSTFSGNAVVNGYGGAVYFLFSQATLRSCTLDANTATGAADAIAVMGAAVRGESLTLSTAASSSLLHAEVFGSMTLVNSVVADCAWPCITFANLGTFTVTRTLLPGGWGGAGGDNIVSTDPMLGPLGNNDGPTRTRAPLTGSPAINAGDNALLSVNATTDQRGLPRISRTTVDLGAVECECGRLRGFARAHFCVRCVC
jgi:hypothetical protein